VPLDSADRARNLDHTNNLFQDVENNQKKQKLTIEREKVEDFFRTIKE